MYADSLSYLKKHFTRNFTDWINTSDWVPNGWEHAQVIGVVNLARMIGEPTLLPTAIIGCTELQDKIVRGFKQEDGSQEHLTLEDLGICFLAKSELRKASIRAVLLTLQPIASSGCKTPSACRGRFRSALARLHAHVDSLVNHDPFASWRTFVKDSQLDICPACVEAVDNRSLGERVNVWNRLPEVLQIEVPGWIEHEPDDGQVSPDMHAALRTYQAHPMIKS